MNLNSFVVIISSLNYAACAKNPCYCNKVNVQIEEHGLKLATLLTVDKNGIEDSFVYKADLGNEEYLYLYKKSPNRWEISNDLNHKSNPELFVNCPFNCPQNCKPWQRKEGGGSLQDFKLTATCKEILRYKKVKQKICVEGEHYDHSNHDMNAVFEFCNANQSCAGIRNLNCEGNIYHTCKEIRTGSTDQRCMYAKKNLQTTILPEGSTTTTNVPGIGNQNTDTATSGIITTSIGPLEIKENEKYVYIGIAISILLLSTVITVCFCAKRRRSSSNDSPETDRVESYDDDDGYDYAEPYKTSNTAGQGNIAIGEANKPRGDNKFDPVFTVENPYYGDSCEFSPENGQMSSHGNPNVTTQNVVVHKNIYYDKSQN